MAEDAHAPDEFESKTWSARGKGGAYLWTYPWANPRAYPWAYPWAYP